jgi:4-methoxybenzoate monooxygenase (O-demethylating)
MDAMNAQTSPFSLYEDQAPQGAPAVDIDPFSQEFFADPYPSHAALRDAGQVVWLSRYNIAATARYEEVRQALLDYKTFSSARGVGLADFSRHGRFRLPSLILEADPPTHTRSRTVLMKALSPAVMRTLRENFAAAAEDMIAALVEKGEIDGCTELAEAYPLKVFPDAIGMRAENRHYLLPYGDMVFNSFGPANELFQAAATRAKEVFPWVESEALRQHLQPGGFGMILYECADAGEITEDEAQKLVRSMLTAGVDTTVNGIGAALFALARFPKQWEKVRADPARLAKAAFEEAVRFESPVQTFFRTTTCTTDFGGVRLEEGRKILLFLGAANRDPRQWQHPDDYDIERKVLGHVGFGAGIHVCVGQLLARLEGEVVLQALAKRVSRIELAGEPERRFNNTLRGLKRLPLRLIPA